MKSIMIDYEEFKCGSDTSEIIKYRTESDRKPGMCVFIYLFAHTVRLLLTTAYLV